jgi:hypothetical protein
MSALDRDLAALLAALDVDDAKLVKVRAAAPMFGNERDRSYRATTSRANIGVTLGEAAILREHGAGELSAR